MTTAIRIFLGFAIIIALAFFCIKVFKLHKRFLKPRKGVHDFYLIFNVAGSLLAAYALFQREWLWLALAPVCFLLDFFLVSKKFYKQTLEDLRSRQARLIAGSVIVVIFSMAGFHQWERWLRLETLMTGIPASATISSVHIGYGRHNRDYVLLWYRHPEKGIQEIRHEGPLKQIHWFAPGQRLAIHYDRANPKRIAIDGREEEIFSGGFLVVFLICAVLWFCARLLLPG